MANPTILVWLCRIGIILELVGFLLVPWEFLDEDAFRDLDDAARYYLRNTAKHATVVLSATIIVALPLLAILLAIQAWLGAYELKEGKTFLLLFLAASSPLLSLAIAKCSKGPVEKGFLHLLTKLAREKGLRLRLLAISAILFAIGTALQLISTL